MAKDQQVKKANSNSSKEAASARLSRDHKKLARLPPTHKIQKRPLLHPPIPSPRTSSSTPKTIYISSSTPFISVLKRIRTLLLHIEDRSSGSVQLTRDGRDTFKLLEKGIANGGGGNKESRPRDEEVQVRATGKAISKALSVAVRLQQEAGWRVRFETVSVGAVDDIVERSRPKKVGGKEKGDVKQEEGGMSVDVNQEGGQDVDMDDVKEEDDAEDMDIEESRIRRVSCFIIYVGLK